MENIQLSTTGINKHKGNGGNAPTSKDAVHRGFGAIRTNVCLTPIQYKSLHSISEKTCMSVSEHMRRAIDQYLAMMGS